MKGGPRFARPILTLFIVKRINYTDVKKKKGKYIKDCFVVNVNDFRKIDFFFSVFGCILENTPENILKCLT